MWKYRERWKKQRIIRKCDKDRKNQCFKENNPDIQYSGFNSLKDRIHPKENKLRNVRKLSKLFPELEINQYFKDFDKRFIVKPGESFQEVLQKYCDNLHISKDDFSLDKTLEVAKNIIQNGFSFNFKALFYILIYRENDS